MGLCGWDALGVNGGTTIFVCVAGGGGGGIVAVGDGGIAPVA